MIFSKYLLGFELDKALSVSDQILSDEMSAISLDETIFSMHSIVDASISKSLR